MSTPLTADPWIDLESDRLLDGLKLPGGLRREGPADASEGFTPGFRRIVAPAGFRGRQIWEAAEAKLKEREHLDPRVIHLNATRALRLPPSMFWAAATGLGPERVPHFDAFRRLILNAVEPKPVVFLMEGLEVFPLVQTSYRLPDIVYRPLFELLERRDLPPMLLVELARADIPHELATPSRLSHLAGTTTAAQQGPNESPTRYTPRLYHVRAPSIDDLTGEMSSWCFRLKGSPVARAHPLATRLSGLPAAQREEPVARLRDELLAELATTKNGLPAPPADEVLKMPFVVPRGRMHLWPQGTQLQALWGACPPESVKDGQYEASRMAPPDWDQLPVALLDLLLEPPRTP